MGDVLGFVVEHAEVIGTVAALVLTAAALITKLTPGEGDDKVVAGVRSVVDFLLSFVKRKPAPKAPEVDVDGETQELDESDLEVVVEERVDAPPVVTARPRRERLDR